MCVVHTLGFVPSCLRQALSRQWTFCCRSCQLTYDTSSGKRRLFQVWSPIHPPPSLGPCDLHRGSLLPVSGGRHRAPRPTRVNAEMSISRQPSLLQRTEGETNEILVAITHPTDDYTRMRAAHVHSLQTPASHHKQICGARSEFHRQVWFTVEAPRVASTGSLALHRLRRILCGTCVCQRVLLCQVLCGRLLFRRLASSLLTKNP